MSTAGNDPDPHYSYSDSAYLPDSVARSAYHAPMHKRVVKNDAYASFFTTLFLRSNPRSLLSKPAAAGIYLALLCRSLCPPARVVAGTIRSPTVCRIKLRLP